MESAIVAASVIAGGKKRLPFYSCYGPAVRKIFSISRLP
ncbi:Uncharacterized protein PPKH_3218 [Pseudomonas putida]|nr:Uncharacterized protein PPKH_3218 [Pseudomonas putida]